VAVIISHTAIAQIGAVVLAQTVVSLEAAVSYNRKMELVPTNACYILSRNSRINLAARCEGLAGAPQLRA
jgi:hypothetical protein